jgi:hypothetical protein
MPQKKQQSRQGFDFEEFNRASMFAAILLLMFIGVGAVVSLALSNHGIVGFCSAFAFVLFASSCGLVWHILVFEVTPLRQKQVKGLLRDLRVGLLYSLVAALTLLAVAVYFYSHLLGELLSAMLAVGLLFKARWSRMGRLYAVIFDRDFIPKALLVLFIISPLVLTAILAWQIHEEELRSFLIGVSVFAQILYLVLSIRRSYRRQSSHPGDSPGSRMDLPKPEVSDSVANEPVEVSDSMADEPASIAMDLQLPVLADWKI